MKSMITITIAIAATLTLVTTSALALPEQDHPLPGLDVSQSGLNVPTAIAAAASTVDYGNFTGGKLSDWVLAPGGTGMTPKPRVGSNPADADDAWAGYRTTSFGSSGTAAMDPNSDWVVQMTWTNTGPPSAGGDNQIVRLRAGGDDILNFQQQGDGDYRANDGKGNYPFFDAPIPQDVPILLTAHYRAADGKFDFFVGDIFTATDLEAKNDNYALDTINIRANTNETTRHEWLNIVVAPRGYRIPEPATVSLLGISGLTLLRRRRRVG